MCEYILAHDLGSSGNKATLYDFKGRLCASALYEYATYYEKDNGVEQDPHHWWEAVCISTKDILDRSGISNSDIACVAFSGQMMGCLPVDKDGEPLRNSLIWADMRASDQAAQIEKLIGNEDIYMITGHKASSSYSAAKLLWIRDNEPAVFKRIHKVLHAKDYIIHKLTGNYVTDYSDASGMNLFDINTHKWSTSIISELDIDESILPELHKSADIAGKVTKEASRLCGLLEGTPVVIGGGDGSCAAVGAGVVSEGKTYNVIGSSSWVSMASKTPIFDEQKRTFNWVHLDPDLYTPCGTMQAAGYSMNWLKNTLCDFEVANARELDVNPYKLIDDRIAHSPAGSNNVVFLPYLLGERSPRWNPDAKGAFMGLKITSTKDDILRSVLEGVGYNLKVIIDILDSKININDMVVIGGGAKSMVWLQILADIWQKTLHIPEYLEEATSMGAAICGGVGIGVFDSFDVINNFNPIKKSIIPNENNKKKYIQLYEVFNDAYDCLIPIFNRLKDM